VKGQTQSKARGREKWDIRNFVVTHVMNAAMTEGKSANMIVGNFDATQFYRDVTNSEPLIHVLNTNEGDENVEPVTLTEDSTLGMFYKYFFFFFFYVRGLLHFVGGYCWHWYSSKITFMFMLVQS
jgi:hypothetical protein